MPISHSRHCWLLKCYRPLHAILWNTELLELWQCAKPWPAHGALGTASRLIWGEIYGHRAWHSLRSFKKRRKEVRVRLTAAPAPPAASLCCVLSQVVEKLKRKKNSSPKQRQSNLLQGRVSSLRRQAVPAVPQFRDPPLYPQ